MKAKRRAEFTGEEFDLDAEIGGGAAEDRLEKSTRLQQNMEATNIRDVGNVKNEGGRDEDSDIDMQMNSLIQAPRLSETFEMHNAWHNPLDQGVNATTSKV